MLFWRYPEPKGCVKVTHVKYFNPEEKTREGISKEHWRLLRLEGNDEFMGSLYNFTESFKFQVGPSYIQIRGEERKLEDKTVEGCQNAQKLTRASAKEVAEQDKKETFPEGANVTICEPPKQARGAWADNIGRTDK